MTPRYNLEEINRTIALLLRPGQVYELRILNTPWATVRGYFDDFEKLTRAAAYMSGRAPGVYLTLNPVARDLLARATNRLVKYARETTSDPNILTRRWLPIDFDPVRPAGISSTDEEHQQAVARAKECMEWLTLQGWPASILADSGNGAHLISRVELANDQDATHLLRDCLQALSFRFDDETVKVDSGNFNAARIWKLYGTLVAKGDSIPERPHRLARVLEAPDPVQAVPLPLLQSLAAQVPKPPSATTPFLHRSRGEPFDLEAWIAGHDIPVRRSKAWNGGQVWVLARCPWNGHEDGAGYIVRFSNGAIAAGCHHNSCQGKGWAELRDAVEPGWREHRESVKSGPLVPRRNHRRRHSTISNVQVDL